MCCKSLSVETPYHAHGFEVCLTPKAKDAMSMRIIYLDTKFHIVTDPDAGLAIMPGEEKSVLESKITLQEVYENLEFGGKVKAVYNYDFGDGWECEICPVGRATPDSQAQMSASDELTVWCLGGGGYGIAEDSGGPPGWDDLKENFKKRKRRASGDDRREWYKKMCANGEPKGLDPYDWDILDVNHALVKAFSPELLTKESQAKGKEGKAKKKA